MRSFEEHISLAEAEELCRLYLDCRLSLVEEAELEYLLGKLRYDSPVISEARESMGIETLCRARIRHERKRIRRYRRIGVSAAAVLMLALTASMVLRFQSPQSSSATHGAASPENVLIAYEGGHRLEGEEAYKSEQRYIDKAEALMAMAEAMESASMEQQQKIINLTSIKQ